MSEQVSRSENALTVSTLAALLTQALTKFFPQPAAEALLNHAGAGQKTQPESSAPVVVPLQSGFMIKCCSVFRRFQDVC